MLSQEDIKNLRQQIFQQIDSNFPEDKKEIAKQQILEMNETQLEEFLKQNNLIQDLSNSNNKELQQNVFRLIVDKKIPSHEIYEDDNVLAVLEINPISKGHTIVIPKKPVSNSNQIPKNILSTAKKISKEIKSNLKSKEVQISSSNNFGESILNVVPIYEDATTDLKRYKAEKDELEEVQKILKIEKPKKIEKMPEKEKPKIEKVFKLPKRIP